MAAAAAPAGDRSDIDPAAAAQRDLDVSFGAFAEQGDRLDAADRPRVVDQALGVRLRRAGAVEHVQFEADAGDALFAVQFQRLQHLPQQPHRAGRLGFVEPPCDLLRTGAQAHEFRGRVERPRGGIREPEAAGVR